jgi:hypothetical protein
VQREEAHPRTEEDQRANRALGMGGGSGGKGGRGGGKGGRSGGKPERTGATRTKRK